MNPQAEESALFDRAFDELRDMRAKEAVSDWNRKHQVGTLVSSHLIRTRTIGPAYISEDGLPEVELYGLFGGIALEQVRAVGS